MTTKPVASLGMRTFGLVAEYDGTNFTGSQLQASSRTVQGAIEDALQLILGVHTRARLASRTDSGVHAFGQVIAFEAVTRLSSESLRNALNFHLPADVKVRCAQQLPDRFDPRRRARSREYVYTINDAPSAPALHRHTEVHVKHRLDVHAMDEAARALVGTHDFAAFAGPATPKGAVTVRRMDFASVERIDERIRVTVRGNAFLHQQVRRRGAALVDAGRGKLSRHSIETMLASSARSPRSRILGPEGLCLTRVAYEGAGECGLPESE